MTWVLELPIGPIKREQEVVVISTVFEKSNLTMSSGQDGSC